MRNIVVFIDSDPSVGGVFYYNRAILNAVSAMPKGKYNGIVIYTNKIWEKYIHDDVERVYVEFNKYNKGTVQLSLMVGIPPSIISNIVGRVKHISRIIIGQKPDLCIFPSQETFWGYTTKVPSLVAIHDLMHRYENKFKEVSGCWKYYHKERHFSNVCKYSSGILVDSELGKRHVNESYGYPLNNIHVLPYIPQFDIKHGNDINNNYKYNLPSRYILYPAQFWEHKNHIRLINAIGLLKKELLDLNLVLIGFKKKEYNNVAKIVSKLKLDDSVVFMDHVPEGDIYEFYQRATAMVMPTFFGPTNIPPLEAFAAGCPVAVSNVYGMPEMVGDAGLLFNPYDVSDIAFAIKQLWLSEDLRNKLICEGYEKAKKWGQAEFNERFEKIIYKLVRNK